MDEIVTVTEAEIVEGMRSLMTFAKLVVEGAGAAATAALLARKATLKSGARVVSIVSGGNVDPEQALQAMAAHPSAEKRP